MPKRTSKKSSTEPGGAEATAKSNRGQLASWEIVTAGEARRRPQAAADDKRRAPVKTGGANAVAETLQRSISPTAKTPKKTISTSFRHSREKIWSKKRPHLHLHRSFRRSYREDYARPLSIPGLFHHAITTFALIFRNWRLFLPFLVLVVILNIFFVGLMSEDTYVQFQDILEETSASLSAGELGTFGKSALLLLSTITTGGLSQGASEVAQVFAVIIFLIIWLVTIYILRQRLAGHTLRLRDALYNALTPLLSSACIVVVMFFQAIPLMIVIITYSAAVTTDFLATPFNALLYFIFAALLTLLSIYLLASSFIALVAVSAPGLYPMVALRAASDLVASRRTKLVIRLVYLIIVVALIFVFTMLPVIALDLVLKGAFDWLAGIPLVPFWLLTVTCFVFIYVTAYCYLYYRRLLGHDQAEAEKN